MRTDEQHTAPTVTEAGIGVQEVGGAVQRHDGLPGARPAVDDERALRARPDDGVLVGLDGGQHVPHPRRTAAAQAGDERGLVVERGMPVESVRGEHLVPVVADPAAGPAIPAAAHQPHRVGVGRGEERFGRGGAPVDQQPTPLAVGEAEAPDVDRLRVVRADDAAEAQVQAETAQGAQPAGQPVDLQVPLQHLPADAAGRPAQVVETVGQLGDRLFEALRDGREVPFVGGDQLRGGLGGQTVGQVERAGHQHTHFANPSFPQVLASRE